MQRRKKNKKRNSLGEKVAKFVSNIYKRKIHIITNIDEIIAKYKITKHTDENVTAD